MASLRDSTKKQYKVHLEKWLAFCRERCISYSAPKVNEALGFLVVLYNKGLTYPTIKTARSALSSVITLESEENFGSHPLVVRFFKGIYELRKPQPKYNSIWDVSKVLDYLRKLHPLNTLTLKKLTLKLVMLLLIATGRRGHDIHLLSLQGMSMATTSCEFQMLEHTKTSKPGKKGTPITIHLYTPDPAICRLLTLKEYILRTAPLRKSETQLFLSFIQPHKAVTHNTISRWTKDVLKLSSIDITQFTAHSTRAAVASKASVKDVPLDVILSNTGWESAQSFHKFYHKPVSHDVNMTDTMPMTTNEDGVNHHICS